MWTVFGPPPPLTSLLNNVYVFSNMDIGKPPPSAMSTWFMNDPIVNKCSVREPISEIKRRIVDMHIWNRDP